MNQKCERDGEGAKWFHISTKGIERSLFQKPQDFVRAINIIAVSSVRSKVRIAAYCLMSNHIHLAVSASGKVVAEAFTNYIKQSYSRYFHKKYGIKEVFDKVPLSIHELNTVQYLKNCLAYILKNPTEARICNNADQYPWSSYGCYFRTQPTSPVRKLSTVSLRESKIILHTHVDLRHSELAMSESGNILPESFVDAKFVEALFGYSRDELSRSIAMNPYLAMEYELTTTRWIALPHHELVKISSELAHKRYKKNLSLLTVNERVSMVLSLSRDYNASPFQICQLLSLSRKTVDQVLGR